MEFDYYEKDIDKGEYVHVVLYRESTTQYFWQFYHGKQAGKSFTFLFPLLICGLFFISGPLQFAGPAANAINQTLMLELGAQALPLAHPQEQL